MTDIDLNALILTWIIDYGPLVVSAALLVGALGIPVPGTIIVIAVGAFVRQELLSLYSTPFLALGGAVLGDVAVYGVGRFASRWIEQRFGQSAAWQKSRDYFERRGGIAIYLTRWLVTPLAVPTNLVAGSSGYPFTKFLLFDVAGEMTWIALYGGLGYSFGSQWELISEVISNFSGLIVSVLAIGVGIYMLIRFLRKPAAEQVAG
jgi:membrane-associated protein